nr:unnamed protein product [Digitaria exilis]
MPVAALHPLPAVVGPTGRSGVRRQARLGLRASSLESASSALTVPNGVAAGAAAVERKEKVKEDKDDVAVKEREEKRGLEALYDDGFGSVTVKDYFAAAKAVSRDDGGPPRWFCPVECGRPAVDDAPLLLFLPGTDGVGMGLILHHKSLGKVFEVRCLHIPVNDRTPFEGLLQTVENTIRHEHNLSPNRPIYLVGDSFGGCLAVAVAARNPQIDLVLILVNPGSYIICKDSIAADIASFGIHAKRISCYCSISSQFCYGLFHLALSPVMMSTLKNGKIVRDLSGIPDQGPVLFVGYHALLGIELSPLYEEFLREKKTIGEEYKLFWPDQPEFVRMAARFGVTVIPFGCVGEDDVLELVLDYNDQKNIPGLREWIESINKETDRVRDSVKGEDGNQDMYLPGLLPKVPGRFYYLFGKPFEMKGMNNLVRDRKSANEVYLRIKSEVEEIMSYLKRKREEDPYRSIAQRALYQATWGISAQVPTFEP